MTDRRKFLKSAAALSAAPLAGRAALAGPASGARFDAFIYDKRHEDARSFAARADAAGVPTRAIAGDITRLWQRELLGRWRDRPGAIAGLTERPALFLLEQLGFEHGLRVAFQAEHGTLRPRAGHVLVRGGNAGLRVELDAAGRSWPLALADALLGDSGIGSRERRPSESGMASHHAEPDKLYSWIIAPRPAV